MASSYPYTTNIGLVISAGDIQESQRRVKTWYPFRFAFRSWVTDNIASGDEEKRKRVGSDYASRMGRLCGAKLFEDVKPYLEMLPSLLASNAGNRKTALRLLDVCQHLAYEEKEKIRKNMDHSTDCRTTNDISSLNTALFAYSIFIAGLLAEKDFPKLQTCLKPSARVPDNNEIANLETFVKNHHDLSITFSRADLKKIFKSRLLTQDRLWGNYKVYFPIRLINAALHAYGDGPDVKDGAIKWAEKVVDGIICLTGADAAKDKVPFKNITKLTIREDRTVEICHSRKSVPLYSELKDKKFGKMTGIEAIKDVAIDHINPIYNILDDPESFMALPTVTAVYDKMKVSGCKDFRPAVVLGELTSELDRINKGHKDFADELLLDLDMFKGNNYQLMSQKENVRKGKGA